uniref:carbohydrate porin n=1 Tax=Mariniphaga sp. TaxID=1954475 RepID=UPI00356340F5
KRVNDLLKAIQQRPGQLIFNGNVTAISQFSTYNNANETYGTGSFDIFATTSFGKGTLLFIDMEAIGGDGPDVLYPTLSGLNGDAGTTQSPDGIDRLHVLEVWGEFTVFKEIFTITVGKIDITNYFDNNASANDETMQFISGSFINNSSFAVPSNSPGIRLRTTLLNRYHLQFGLSSQDNAGSRLFNDLYRIASLGFTFAPGSGFESNIRLYGYQVPAANNDYGFGVSLDKVFFNKFNVFGRYGLNSDAVADYWGVKSSWSAGLRFVELINKQPLAIGFAYGENYSAINNVEKEKITELYVRRQLNKWVHISPHFQYIWNRMRTNEDFAVIGIRTHFNF